MTNPRRLPALIAAALFLTAAGSSPLRGTTVAEVRARGKLVVLCFPHQESAFVRVNLDLGPMPKVGPPEHFIGIDVDLMRAFAAELGVGLEIRPVTEPSYASLIPELLGGRGDLVASSFSITAERREKVDFSDPYFTVFPVFLVRLDSPIASFKDLAGRTGATVWGSSHEEHLKRLGIPPRNLLHVDFILENYTAVMERDADFTLVDSFSAMRFLAGRPQLRAVFRLPEEDHYGIAVLPGSDLGERFNQFLAAIKESGQLETIIRRHMPAGIPSFADLPVISNQAERKR